jgi:hypothetical protein
MSKVVPLKPWPALEMPEHLWSHLNEFLLDKKTGSIQLNIKDGRILGLHLNEIIRST